MNLIDLCKRTKKDGLKHVKKCLASGVDINARDARGMTALMNAVISINSGSTEGTVKLLIKSGADINLQDFNGITALMFASHMSNWCI